MDVVLESIDLMKALLHAIRDNGNDTSVGIDITDICVRLDAISNGNDIPEQGAASSKVEESVVIEDDNADYSNMSDKDVEDEIERLLKMRKEEDKKRREVNTPVSTPSVASSTISFKDDDVNTA